MHALLAGSSFASEHEVEVKLEDDAGVLRQDRQVSISLVSQKLNTKFLQLLSPHSPPMARSSI
jgi:phenylalanine ammonia-lyase